MGYYDFDHFWSPEEVCAQKTTSESTRKVLKEVRKFFHELLGSSFGDRVSPKETVPTTPRQSRDPNWQLIQSPEPDYTSPKKNLASKDNSRDI